MHQIEILRAPYVLQILFSDFWGMFSVQNSNVFVQENFVLTFKKSDLFFNFKSKNKILLDKYIGILSWKHAPKTQKKKLKNIRSPQNFDLMHSFCLFPRSTYVANFKINFLKNSDLGDLNEPCLMNFNV